jgi:hypothetical protein
LEQSRSALLVFALSVAACSSGGGSSGGDAAAAVDPSHASSAAPAAAQVFVLQNGGSLTLNADGTATVATGTGDSFAVSPTAAPPPADAPTFGGARLAHQTAAGPDFVIERMGNSAGLSTSDFGVWNSFDGAGNLATTNFYAGGEATPPALLPPQGSGVSATYNGSYIANLQSSAIYAGAPIAAGPFQGSAQITVDFGAGAVQASLGGLLADTFSTSSSIDRGAGTYTLNGGTFSPFAAASYTLGGAFYGTPQAGQAPPETAGTIAGTIGHGTPTAPAAIFTGSFGARR